MSQATAPISFQRGRVPDNNIPAEALGGLVTDYYSPRRRTISNQLLGRWESKNFPGKGVIFTASAVNNKQSYGKVPQFVKSAENSGVQPLQNPTHSTDLELFLLDSGAYAVGLAHLYPSGNLNSDIVERKMTGWPFFINTYLTFITSTPR